MIKADLAQFRLKVREYRLLVNRSQSDLAAYIDLDYNELSNRLNAHKKAHLTHDNVQAIVRALAQWGAIVTNGQAEELLEIMLCPHFDPADLEARPLSKLTTSPAPTVPATPTNLPPPTSQTATGPEHANNLPQQLSSFIGRHKEIAELTKLLDRDRVRLLTLVGAGGCGKTRLSLQVAATLLDSFQDGVWFVELAPLTDPALLLQTIAITLGLKEKGERPILATLSDYLRSRHLLLVLDNCEHLVEECSLVVNTLLHNSTRLQILASSREAFNLIGETTFRVPSLSLPDPQIMPGVDSLPDYEAVRLFIERAVKVNPHFSITKQNAQAVVELCRQLDGIPLAIELAAARIKMLTVEQIVTRLNDRFRLLTGGNRTALPRQQTLRALVDWSYDLLSPAEKNLLAQLSVFAGGWSLNAALAVSKGKDLEEYEILDALSGLINKSLMQVEDYGDGVEARYRFLETIRQYGLEKLQAGGEEEEVRQRHLSYYSSQVAELGPKLLEAEQPEILKWMDMELDNIRAALAFGLQLGQFEAVFQLINNTYWDLRNYYSEGRRNLEQALDLPGARGVSRGKVLYWAGRLARFQGDSQIASNYFKECLVLGREYEDAELLWFALYGLGALCFEQENYAAALNYFDEALVVTEGMSKFYKSIARLNLGIIFTRQENYEQGRHLYEEAMSIGRELGNPWAIFMVLGAQARLAMIEEDYPAAHRYLDEAQPFGEEVGLLQGISGALIYRAIIWSYEGKFKEAREALEASLDMGLEGDLRIEASNALLGASLLLSKVWLKRRQKDFPEQVACLCGATSVLKADIKQVSNTPFHTYYVQALEVARSGLDEAAFEVAFARGQAMLVEEATAYARQALAGI